MFTRSLGATYVIYYGADRISSRYNVSLSFSLFAHNAIRIANNIRRPFVIYTCIYIYMSSFGDKHTTTYVQWYIRAPCFLRSHARRQMVVANGRSLVDLQINKNTAGTLRATKLPFPENCRRLTKRRRTVVAINSVTSAIIIIIDVVLWCAASVWRNVRRVTKKIKNEQIKTGKTRRNDKYTRNNKRRLYYSRDRLIFLQKP